MQVRIPSKYYEDDGEIIVRFRAQLDETIKNESAGFDNIKIIAKVSCDDDDSDGGDQQPDPKPNPKPDRKPDPKPSPPKCSPNRVITREDFEDGSVNGWTNGRIDEGDVFTKFLGRFGKGDKDPWKKYTGIPKQAKELVLVYDFYEIDSWDASHKDSALVFINHKAPNLGYFDSDETENGRTGKGRNQLKFFISSRGPPKNIGFGHWKDQIHRVTVRIPPRYYRSDGTIEVRFRTSLNEAINKESAGFDNIKIIAKFDCDGGEGGDGGNSQPAPGPEPGSDKCKPKTKVLEDNFEDQQVTGWTNGKIEKGGKAFSWFLGRYDAHDTNKEKFPKKTYHGLNPQADSVRLEVDFYEIDSWEGATSNGRDQLWIFIDGVRLAIGPFNESVEERTKTGSAEGINWIRKSLGKPKKLGFKGKSKDQKHRLVIKIPKQYYKDGEITVQFVAGLDDSNHDKSAGFDNIKFFEMYKCERRGLLQLDGDSDRLEDEIDLVDIWEDEEMETNEDDEEGFNGVPVEAVGGTMGTNLRGSAVF